MRGENKPPRSSGRSFGAGPTISGNPAGSCYTPQPGDNVGVVGDTLFWPAACVTRFLQGPFRSPLKTFVWRHGSNCTLEFVSREKERSSQVGLCSNLRCYAAGKDVSRGYIFQLAAPSFCRSHCPFFCSLVCSRTSIMFGKKYYGLTGTNLNIAVGIIAGLDFLLFGYDQGNHYTYIRLA